MFTHKFASACWMFVFLLAIAFLSCCASSNRQVSPGMFSGENVVSFKVHGMACRNCAREIAHELQEVPGVRGAMIDFDTQTAKVAVDPDRTRAPSMDALHAAVEKWRREHFGLDEDPDCLDPQRREQIKREAR